MNPDLQQKMAQWDARSPVNQQLAQLRELSNLVSLILNELDRNRVSGENTFKGLGAVTTDIRNAIRDLNKKEAPKMPDYSVPIVESVSKLEKALTKQIEKIELKPNFTPEIRVAPPIIPKPDLSEINKILSKDIPKAFEKAISLIPKVDIPETDFSPILKELEKSSNFLFRN
jgi:hypothetical protein